MFTHEQREEAFAAGTATQQELYDGPEAGVALGAIAQKHGLVGTHVAFSIAIGDVILGLVPQEKLPDLLIERLEITRPEAMKVTADVLDFLAPLGRSTATAPTVAPATSSTPDTATSTKPAPRTIPITPINTPGVAPTEPAAAPLTAEPTPAAQPLRTMAEDMATLKQAAPTAPAAAGTPAGSPPAEPVHQATSQDDLIADGPGNSIQNQTASWDSAR